jgi:hypothetical protein
MVTPPDTSFSRSGDVQIAYQVSGEGAVAVVLVGGPASHLTSASGQELLTPEQRKEILDIIEENWGEGGLIPVWARTMVGAQTFAQWWRRFERAATAPPTARELLAMLAESDLRAHLGRMRAPTLVLHRGEDTLVPVASGRRLAQSIPRARFVELSGRGNLSFVGEVDELVDEVEEFLTGGRLGGNGLAAKGFPGPRCSRSHPLMLGWPRQRR